MGTGPESWCHLDPAGPSQCGMNDSDLWQDVVGTGEVSFLPLVAGLPVERGGEAVAAGSEAVMLGLETPALAGPAVCRRQTTVTSLRPRSLVLSLPGAAVGVSHTCTADATPTWGGILRAELAPGTTSSSSLPPQWQPRSLPFLRPCRVVTGSSG